MEIKTKKGWWVLGIMEGTVIETESEKLIRKGKDLGVSKKYRTGGLLCQKILYGKKATTSFLKDNGELPYCWKPDISFFPILNM
ncbi:MAG: hypothetical protein K2N51_19270 [Lachnospiraceae bacterium]|nr:hypothetical protein [Lachnospiraceae bacterium]